MGGCGWVYVCVWCKCMYMYIVHHTVTCSYSITLAASYNASVQYRVSGIPLDMYILLTAYTIHVPYMYMYIMKALKCKPSACF